MPWTNPATLTPGYVVTDADWNMYVRDNPNWLFNRPMAKKVYNGNYSTTSSSFVDADATNLILTLMVASSRVLLFGSAWCQPPAGQAVAVDWIVDSATRIGDATWGLAATGLSNTPSLLVFSSIVMGLAAGAHTFKPQFRSAGGASAIFGSGLPISLWALEI